jgi:hypothetical protein
MDITRLPAVDKATFTVNCFLVEKNSWRHKQSHLMARDPIWNGKKSSISLVLIFHPIIQACALCVFVSSPTHYRSPQRSVFLSYFPLQTWCLACSRHSKIWSDKESWLLSSLILDHNNLKQKKSGFILLTLWLESNSNSLFIFSINPH